MLDRAVDRITSFTGSMPFVYLHLLWIGSWIIYNLGWLGFKPFDPYPFGLLTMLGSLEAIETHERIGEEDAPITHGQQVASARDGRIR